MKQRLRIFGAGARGRLVADLIAWQFQDGISIEGYYDDGYPALSVGPGGTPVLGRIEAGIRDVAGSGCGAFLALGTKASWRACEILAELRPRGVPFARLVSPQALVSPSVTIGENAIVLPGVFIGSGVRIGDLLCAHGGAVIEHDCQIGHNVVIGPGTCLAGAVKVGSHALLGARCSVAPSTTIGRGTLVGAGSVVVQDLPPHVVAFGTPAAPQRPVQEGDEAPDPDRMGDLERLGFA